MTILSGPQNSWVDLFFASADEECVSVERPVVGTLGGHPLSYLGQSQTEFAEPTQCYLHFETSGPVVPDDGIIRIWDESLEVVATFDRAALEQRIATHPSWVFERERTESISWSHPSDLVENGASPSISFHTGMFNPVFAVVFVPPNTLTFTLPADFPLGTFDVSVVAQYGKAEYALECLNAIACFAHQSREYAHSATVIP